MIEDWFSEFGGIGFSAFAECFDGEPKDVSIVRILQLDEKNLAPFTLEVLKTDASDHEFEEDFCELRWGLRAFQQFQDILDVVLDGSDVFNRHYCYYESLVYLRESVTCWLNKNLIAALTLVRPFLELSTLHLYWYLRCRGSNYKAYYAWLNGDRGEKGKPTFNGALDSVFEELPGKNDVNDKRLSEMKLIIKNCYKTLCSYNHSPTLRESITSKNRSLINVSYESFTYVLFMTNMLLRQMAYLYIIAYPLSIFPVDGWEKWGFSGPVGIFLDKWSFGILTAFLRKENISNLQKDLRSNPEVIERLEWFQNLPYFTKEQLNKSWDEYRSTNNIEKNPTDINQRIAMFKARFRALRWGLNYVNNDNEASSVDIPDKIVQTLVNRLRNW